MPSRFPRVPTRPEPPPPSHPRKTSSSPSSLSFLLLPLSAVGPAAPPMFPRHSIPALLLGPALVLGALFLGPALVLELFSDLSGDLCSDLLDRPVLGTLRLRACFFSVPRLRCVVVRHGGLQVTWPRHLALIQDLFLDSPPACLEYRQRPQVSKDSRAVLARRHDVWLHEPGLLAATSGCTSSILYP